MTVDGGDEDDEGNEGTEDSEYCGGYCCCSCSCCSDAGITNEKFMHAWKSAFSVVFGMPALHARQLKDDDEGNEDTEDSA